MTAANGISYSDMEDTNGSSNITNAGTSTGITTSNSGHHEERFSPMRTRGGIAFGYGVDVEGARKQIDLDTGKTGYTQSRNDITNKIPNAGFWTHKATADEDHGENTLSPMKTRGGKAFGHGLRPEDVQKPSDIDATLDTNLIHLDLLVDYSAWTEYETVSITDCQTNDQFFDRVEMKTPAEIYADGVNAIDALRVTVPDSGEIIVHTENKNEFQELLRALKGIEATVELVAVVVWNRSAWG